MYPPPTHFTDREITIESVCIGVRRIRRRETRVEREESDQDWSSPRKSKHPSPLKPKPENL